MDYPETNLGIALNETKVDVFVGTKVQLQIDELDSIEPAIVESVERSLKRLQKEYVDLVQLHNFIASVRRPERGWVNAEDLELCIGVFQKLQKQGKVRHWGFNGLGEPKIVLQALSKDVATVQTCYNLLNPSAGVKIPPDYPFEDYGQLIDVAAKNDVGVIAIRVLAGGALSGSASRHPNAAQSVDPIA